MNIIHNTLGGLELGAPVAHRNLAVVPLLLADGVEVSDPGYLVLDEALEAKRCRVTEVSEGGSVPELLFVNEADRPILLLDGEELVGAKQNRVLNVTLLVGAKQALQIPVSCVEQGRWSWRSRDFASAKRAMFAKGRREKMAQVSMNLRHRGSRRADQAAVWDSVAMHSVAFSVSSPTAAMADVYEDQAEALDEMRRGFPSQPRQVGAMFFVAGEVAGLELFDAPSTFSALSSKLIDSYAMDALASRSDSAERPAPDLPAPDLSSAEAFLAEVAKADLERYDALGEGTDLRLHGTGLVGGALAASLGGETAERIVHLSAFRLPEAPLRSNAPRDGESGRASRLASLAVRRRARGRQH